MKLIDKSALVAEIKRRKGMCDNHYGDYWNGCYNTFTDILSFIDTLEVKEVDLEKSLTGFIGRYAHENSGEYPSAIDIAKHFFELSLKAQKGEKV